MEDSDREPTGGALPSRRAAHQRSTRWGLTAALALMAVAAGLSAVGVGGWALWLSTGSFVAASGCGWMTFPIRPTPADDLGTRDPAARRPAPPAVTELGWGLATVVLTVAGFALIAVGAG